MRCGFHRPGKRRRGFTLMLAATTAAAPVIDRAVQAMGRFGLVP
jgi:hypothetical protein